MTEEDSRRHTNASGLGGVLGAVFTQGEHTLLPVCDLPLDTPSCTPGHRGTSCTLEHHAHGDVMHTGMSCTLDVMLTGTSCTRRCHAHGDVMHTEMPCTLDVMHTGCHAHWDAMHTGCHAHGDATHTRMSCTLESYAHQRVMHTGSHAHWEAGCKLL